MASPVVEASPREERLRAHAQYFDRIMTFLPTNIGQHNKPTIISTANTDFMHNKKGTPTPKLERAMKKQNLDAAKSKKRKIDEVDADQEEEKEEKPKKSKKKAKEIESESGSESDSDDMDIGDNDDDDDSDDDDEDDSDNEGDSDDEGEGNGNQNGENAVGFASDLADREVLKQRLREKLQELKKQRKVVDDPNGPPKKKRRIEDAKKKAMNKELEKQRLQKAQKIQSEKGRPHATEANQEKKSGDAGADIEFAKFDFGTDLNKYSKKDAKAKLGGSKKRNLQKALHVATERQEVRKEKGVESDANAAWDGMLARARGEKVLDDVARIKKALRNDEKKKKRSAKEWNERLDMQKKSSGQRLKQREKNIAEKKQGKGGKKGKGKGKGKKDKRAGFEGK